MVSLVMNQILKFSVLFLIVLSFGCSEENLPTENPEIIIDDIQITRYGSDSTFDLATWNIEYFPKSLTYTIPYLCQIIKDIDLDMIAIQEIDNNTAFYTLLDSLPGYDGYVASVPDYGQRLGFIYKTDLITVSTAVLLFEDDDWLFPRPPLLTYVSVKKDGQTVFDFTMIILHFKAFEDAESESRRRNACIKLHNYIDLNLLTGDDTDVIVLGDMNDEIDDPSQSNVFTVFLEDTMNYEFITMPIADEPTYIGGGYLSTIDHILITDNVRAEFNEGTIQVIKPDLEFSKYQTYISDHRPVLAQFFIF